MLQSAESGCGKIQVSKCKKTSQLREKLRASDIVNCKEVEEEKTSANLMKLSERTCQTARSEQERVEEKERIRIAQEEAGKARIEAQRVRKEEEERRAREEAERIEEIARQMKANNAEKSKAPLSSASSSPQNSQTIRPEAYGDKAFAGLFPASTKEQVIETSKTEEESQKGFFGKAVDKIKSGFKKSVDFVKDVLPFMDSEKELIAKVNQLCESKRRFVSLSQVVYQSVKTPQIERQDKESRRPFDDYDLVIDKPAGVIVRIRKSSSVRKGLQFKGF